MKNLVDRIAKLTPEARALLELKLKQKARSVTAASDGLLRRRADAEAAPLSFAQQRLWFLDQLEPDIALYNIPTPMRLEGALDGVALEKALDTIVARHEVLRTTIIATDGAPAQLINEPRPINLQKIDLSNRSETERRADLHGILEAEARRRFNLSRDLMLRAILIKLAPADHVLSLVTHHIASDGWSSEILFRELETLYAAFSTGKPNPLPELPLQYSDYAVWQRQWLQGEIVERQLSYWKQQLAGLSVLNLPVDRPQSVTRTYRGAEQSFAFPRSLSDQFKVISRKQGVTLFMTLLAAFQTLLQRYTGQHDVVVGSPIAGRTRPAIETLIGFFVNTVVLRSDCSGNPTFLELLARVREVCLGAYSHQDLPFEKLVEELQPERTISNTPLFQVMFGLQNAPTSGLQLPKIKPTPLKIRCGTTKFDLTLFMQDEPGGLKATLQYNTDVFNDITISRMLGHFQTLLEAIAENPEQHIADLPILPEAERHRLVFDWNDTSTAYPSQKCIHQLFEEQAEQMPATVAAVFGDQQLTYRELNQRANQLARYLRKLGVGPEVLVGLCVERSLEMVVGMLGILKAGGAYLPLDPTYPTERQAFMLADCEAPVLITQKRLLQQVFEDRSSKIEDSNARVKFVYLDTDWKTIAQESEDNLSSEVAADNLAYVIYTSGSTGKPKGVAVCHRSVNRLVRNTNYIGFVPGDTVAQASTCSFDAATFEIWGALLNGARLVGVSRDTLLSAKAFAAQIEEQKISIMFLTTALFNQLAKEAPQMFSKVRYLLFGGEAADPACVAQVLQQGAPGRLLNVYGPTETTTFATWYHVRQVPGQAKSIPIGKPIANTRVVILDSNGTLVPIGVVGELYVGGAGVARGYVNRPELTAERFVEDPYSEKADSRLYRTGDLVRYLPDGNIEFIGRSDHQVKIRGYRIEPGEIEVVLRRHPRVRHAVVAAQEDEAHGKRLTAYLVTDMKAAVTPQALREFLRAHLPEYMIPLSFIFLDTLPLTSNGKIDRQALPVTDEIRRELKGAFVAPRTLTEKQIAGIWAKVLKLDEIGIHDNFFDLGGHSLLAVRVTSEIEKALGKSLRLSAIFQAPTVAQLASLLTSHTPPRSWSSLAALQPIGSKSPFFWVHGESSDAFLPRYLGSDQPLYGLMHQSEDGRPARYTAVESIAAHYLSEIRTVQPNGPYFLGGYCFGGMVAFELAQQLKSHGEEVGLLVLLEPSDPWNGRSSPVAVPATIGLSSKAPLFHREAFRHLHNLKILKTERKLSYAFKRIAGKLGTTANNIMNPVRQILKKAVWELYLAAGCTLPSCLRNPYILHVYRRAIRSYVPRTYPGPMVVFQTEKHLVGSHSAWIRLASGAVEVYAVPGNHTDVLTEANVQVWAGQLKTCLDRARSMVYRTPASANDRANAFSVVQRYRRNTGQDDHLRQSSHAIQLVAH